MEKKKIALCYSGAVRGLLLNLEQVKKVFFDGDQYEIDYYLYADPNGGTVHEKDIENGKVEPQGLKVKKEMPEFNCLFEDESAGFNQRLDKFKKLIKKYHMPYEQQVHQWHGIKKVFDFVFSQEKEYDVYVRLRCDLFPAGKMEFDWSHFDENTVYVPFNGNFGGINDRFAFGSKKAMRTYSNFYDSDIYYFTNSRDGIAEKKAQQLYDKYYSHIKTAKYGNGKNNSEIRLLNYLYDRDMEIEILPPENLHAASVRDSDGLIRYPGPDLEEMLLNHNQAKIEDLKYDRKWWR